MRSLAVLVRVRHDSKRQASAGWEALFDHKNRLSNTMDDTTILRGVVHGRTIELESDTGLPDGETVTVTVRRSSGMRDKLPPGEGLRRAFGGWKDDDPEGLDEYLEWSRQQRKVSRPELDP